MTSVENWRPVVGYEGIYEVSDLGRVRSVDRIEPYMNRRRSGRILRPRPLRKGYLLVGLKMHGKERGRLVHRLVLDAFVGPCPEGMEARHFPDRDPANCRLDNLQWDTPQRNAADKKAHGTENCGARNGRAKIAEADVIRIREMRRSGATQSAIASVIGISQSMISMILRGKKWAHLRV
jgi:hypothetical protein